MVSDPNIESVYGNFAPFGFVIFTIVVPYIIREQGYRIVECIFDAQSVSSITLALADDGTLLSSQPKFRLCPAQHSVQFARSPTGNLILPYRKVVSASRLEPPPN